MYIQEFNGWGQCEFYWKVSIVFSKEMFSDDISTNVHATIFFPASTQWSLLFFYILNIITYVRRYLIIDSFYFPEIGDFNSPSLANFDDISFIIEHCECFVYLRN